MSAPHRLPESHANRSRLSPCVSRWIRSRWRSPSGQARVYLYAADRPRAGLVLGHGAGGGVTAPDLVAVRDAALAEEVTVALVEQPVPSRRATLACPGASAGRSVDRRGGPADTRARCEGCRSSSAAAPRARGWRAERRRRRGRSRRCAWRSRCSRPAVPARLRRPAGSASSTRSRCRRWSCKGRSDRFGIPPAAARRTVVEVAGDHGLKTDLQAVAAAARAWLARILAPSTV